MESVIVHPESAEQLKTVKAFLKSLKIQFEPQVAELPGHVISGIEKSLGQQEAGQMISLQEFKQKHFSK